MGDELAEGYGRIIYAETGIAVDQAGARFDTKWPLQCPHVVKSLEEGDDALFTFLRFPRGSPKRSGHRDTEKGWEEPC